MKTAITLTCCCFFIHAFSWAQAGSGFVPNKGQWDSPFLFRLDEAQSSLFLERDGFTLAMYEAIDHGPHLESSHIESPRKGHALKIRFLNALESSKAMGLDPLAYRLNYYLGKDRNKWVEDLKPMSKISYKEIYPGIELLFKQDQGAIKYDLILDAGADPKQIEWRYEGADTLFLDTDNNLIAATSLGEYMELAPIAYQITAQGRKEVACRFSLRGQVLGFEFPESYDKSLSLIIDPALIFSTYSGSKGNNFGFTATYDLAGNAYGGGIALSGGYPTTAGAFQDSTNGGGREVTLSKYSPDGSQLLFSTYLGGQNQDQPHSLVSGPYERLYIMGRTSSPDFPTTLTAYDTIYKGEGDLFITCLDSIGQMIGSTYLGGTGTDGNMWVTGVSAPSALQTNYGDDARGEIDLDEEGNCLIASVTSSQDFALANIPLKGFGGGLDGCIAKMSPDLDQLIWSSYLGGAGDDAIYSICPIGKNELLICGGTTSSDFPISPNAAERQYGGVIDGFVAHISTNPTRIISSSYVGATLNIDQAYFVEQDRHGDVYILGQTTGDIDTIGQVYRALGANQFVSKFNSDLSQILLQTTFGTILTSTPDISLTAFLVDNCGHIYVSGWGPVGFGPFQGILPTTPDAFMDTTDGSHFYLAVFERDMDSLLYASYFAELSPQGSGSTEHVDGGTSRFDKQGIVYQAVCASCDGSNQFPTTPGVYSPQNGARSSLGTGGGGCNMAVFKMDFQLPNLSSAFRPEDEQKQATFEGCSPFEVQFNNLSSAPSPRTKYAWNFGDGSPIDSSLSPKHIYTKAGFYQVQLIAYNPDACQPYDTSYHTLEVFENTLAEAGPNLEICRGESIQIQAVANGGNQISWTPESSLSNPALIQPIAQPDSSTLYHLILSDQDQCISRDSMWVIVKSPIKLTVSPTTPLCRGDLVTLSATGASTYRWAAHPALSDLTIASPIAIPDSSTTFWVYGDADSVCTDSASIQVNVFEKPFTQAWGEPLQICEGHSATLYASGGSRILWRDGNEQNPRTVRPRESRLYQVTAYNGPCYTHTDSVFIEVFPWPVADFTMDINGLFAPSIIQFNNLSQDAHRYTWTFGDGSLKSYEVHPMHAFQDSGRYTIKLEAWNELNCKSQKKIEVEIAFTNFEVPTAFSPNQDGYNDEFFIPSTGLNSLEMRIFNRWGKVVFESDEVGFRWDGTYQGRSVPEGVYTYSLKVIGENNLVYPKQGTITIFR